jgi:dihydroflavonol-4-reductase
MLVLITGGTGYLGSHTVAEVVKAGHQVRLLVRSQARVAPALAPLGVDTSVLQVLVGDITDPAAVRPAVDGVDAVIHCGGVFTYDSRARGRIQSVHVPGTVAVLDEARRAGVPKIVYVSSIAGFLGSTTPLITPYAPIGDTTEPYCVSQGKAELLARQYQTDGAPLAITYPLIILGPHDPNLGDGLGRMKRILQGKLPVLPTGGFVVGDVRDVGRMHAATLTADDPRGRYMLGGEYMSTQLYVELLREVTGHPLPIRFLPASRLLRLGRVANGVSRLINRSLPLQYGPIHMCFREPHLDPSVHEALGVTPRPLTETIADSVRWLYQSGHITAEQAGRAARTDQPALTRS